MFFFSIIQLPPLLNKWNDRSPSSIFLFFSKFIIFLQFVLQCNKMNNFCIFVQLVGVKRLHLSFSKRIHKWLKYIPVITPIKLNECTHGACCTWICNTYVMQNKKKNTCICVLLRIPGVNCLSTCEITWGSLLSLSRQSS